MKPYDTNLEHLLAELSRIDLLIKTFLENWLEDFPAAGNEFRGLYISDEEIEQIQKTSGFESKLGISQDINIERLKEIKAIRTLIDVRIEESLKTGRELRLHKLSDLFDLDSNEIDILLIGLAPELDLKYEKLYSYLQNDVTKKKPTIDLILNLFFPTIEEKIKSRAYFSSVTSLRKNNLIHLFDGEINTGSALISSFIKVDERIINFLLGFDELDLKIQDSSYLLKPERTFDDLILPKNLENKLMNTASWHIENNLPLRLLFCGPSGSGKKSVAEVICREAGLNLLVLNSKLMLEGRLIDTAHIIMREALLQNSAIYFQDFNVLLEDKEPNNYSQPLINVLKKFPGWIFLAGRESMEFREGLLNNGFIPVSFPLPSYSVRRELWNSCLKTYKLAEEVDLDELANKFRFSGGKVRDAALSAINFAGQNNPACPVISLEDLYKGCKAQSNQKLNSLALKTNPQYSWDDIVLPKDTMDHLKEISGFIKNQIAGDHPNLKDGVWFGRPPRTLGT